GWTPTSSPGWRPACAPSSCSAAPPGPSRWSASPTCPAGCWTPSPTSPRSSRSSRPALSRMAPMSRSRPARSARALFAASLLLSEALVVLFAGLVAYGLELVPVPTVLWGGGALAVWAVLAGALVRRGTVGYVLGWVL